jgi:hypothetical protein
MSPLATAYTISLVQRKLSAPSVVTGAQFIYSTSSPRNIRTTRSCGIQRDRNRLFLRLSSLDFPLDVRGDRGP